ncbi:GAF domain-containing protein [Actinoplanes sp. CA-030573]|uniref:GAF domain-containing protein n=1 Tax=Actinoplanes sp. CA-030573 TaxID=3239898 RepID=UPI003D950AA9
MTPTIDDRRRLTVLSAIDLDHPELRKRLDEIAERAASRLGRPVGLVSMVLDTAQFFAGSYGLEGWLAELRGTPIEWSFCVNAVMSGEPYVVPDAAADLVQSANPLVTADGVRTYAGVPIVVDGVVLGAHCVLGFSPSEFGPEDLDELRRGAEEIAEVFDAYRTDERPASPGPDQQGLGDVPDLPVEV